jgi:hypothetical protein
MKALTLHQPWATLIAIGAKTMETRSWSTPYRGPLAIHAAKYLTEDAGWLIKEPVSGKPYRDALSAAGFRIFGDLPRGAIVATCQLVDCLPTERVTPEDFGDYTPGRWAWVLRDVQPLAEPVVTRGYQGLWDWHPLASP